MPVPPSRRRRRPRVKRVSCYNMFLPYVHLFMHFCWGKSPEHWITQLNSSQCLCFQTCLSTNNPIYACPSDTLHTFIYIHSIFQILFQTHTHTHVHKRQIHGSPSCVDCWFLHHSNGTIFLVRKGWWFLGSVFCPEHSRSWTTQEEGWLLWKKVTSFGSLVGLLINGRLDEWMDAWISWIQLDWVGLSFRAVKVVLLK